MPGVASPQFQRQQLGLQKRHVTHARATPSVQPSGLPALLRRTAACRSQGAQRQVAVAAAAPDPLPPRNSTNGALPTTLSARVLGQIDRVTVQPPPEEVADVLASSDIIREALVGDDFKERDRKLLRTVYDFEAWKRHRSSGRYWRHMQGIFKSRTVRWMGAPLAYVMSVATTVAVYHSLADIGVLPDVLPEIKSGAAAPFGLTSFALSSLLVLRTNTSYQRWDEARKMWGLIVNRSRDVTRQALGYIPSSQPDLQDMFCRWVIAYSRSLMCHLREGENLDAELKDTLKPQELKALLASAHRPNYTCQVLTAVIKAAQLGDNIDNRDSGANVKASAAFRMDENLTVFADVTGGCERILRTPVPLAYTRHNSRFLLIWLTLLPFTLWDTCHWGMLPVTGLVAFLLLGIKEIGVTIEEPFSILPLEVISRTIETNVLELQATHGAQALAGQSQAARADGGMDADALVNAVVPAVALSRSKEPVGMRA